MPCSAGLFGATSQSSSGHRTRGVASGRNWSVISLLAVIGRARGLEASSCTWPMAQDVRVCRDTLLRAEAGVLLTEGLKDEPE